MAAGSRSAVRRRQFARLGAWAGIACLALLAAVIAASTEAGSRRIANLFNPDASTRSAQKSNPQGGRAFDAEPEMRRLTDAIRTLAADRDRLMTRITVLERNLDDVTGSVGGTAQRQALPPIAANPAPQASGQSRIAASHSAAAGATTQSAPGQTALSQTPAPQAPPAPPPPSGGTALDSIATRTDFGIDLGGNSSIDGLRALWNNLRTNQPALFEGMRALVAIRESQRQPSGVELRLVVGPVANAAAAARMCAALSAAAQACQPSVFDGQRLALQ